MQQDAYALGVGLIAVLLLGIVYTVTVPGLAASGAPLTFDPRIRIPSNDYYFWEMLFTVPVFVRRAILSSGMGCLVAKSLGGRAAFEQTLAALGVASTLPWHLTWIVETAGAGLMLSGAISSTALADAMRRPGFWRTFVVTYQLVALGWYLFLTPLAVRVVHGLGWQKSIPPGGTVAIVLAITMSVFIR